MDTDAVPAAAPARAEMLGLIRDELLAAKRVVLTTHVNADGDGAGSEAAVAAWLAARGITVHILNPTPFPEAFLHLLEDRGWLADPASADGMAALNEADAILVLDTGEPKRAGRVGTAIGGREVLVIDHHLPAQGGFDGLVLQDPTACATGELIYDMLDASGLHRPWPSRILEAIYTAIITDTGSFRFSNTTPRTHALAGDLLAQGVDPEAVYRKVYGNVPLARLHLLRHALERLELDPELPITWTTVDRAVMKSLDTGADDLDGIIEQIRNVRGTEVAILFRETSDGATKISLRSAGRVNVNTIAREFGGGGHEKASGALINGRPDNVRPRVLDAVRRAVIDSGAGFRRPEDAG